MNFDTDKTVHETAETELTVTVSGIPVILAKNNYRTP